MTIRSTRLFAAGPAGRLGAPAAVPRRIWHSGNPAGMGVQKRSAPAASARMPRGPPLPAAVSAAHLAELAWQVWATAERRAGAAARGRSGIRECDSPEPERPGRRRPAALPAGFDAERFLRLVAGRDAGWLEAASCLILPSRARPNAEAPAELVGGQSGERPIKCCHCRGDDLARHRHYTGL